VKIAKIIGAAAAVVAAPVIIDLGLVLIMGRQGVLELVFGPVERPVFHFAALARATTPNNFLVCPQDYCAAKADMISPTINLSATEFRDRSLAIFKRQPRTRLIGQDVTTMRYVFEVRSLLIGFPDTVTIRFIPLGDNRATLAIYSRSHYGRSDLGVNEERIRRWIKLIFPQTSG